jgi:hypothetical protein
MEPEPTSTQSDIRQHVSLSAYEWHQLLGELEHGMRIVNRDTDVLISLYEKIGSQLSGRPLVVERRKQPTESVSEQRKPDSSFWSKFKK